MCVSLLYARSPLADLTLSQTLPCLADCGSAFSDFEARRFLPQSTLELLYRVRAEKELDEAGLEGLEKCP